MNHVSHSTAFSRAIEVARGAAGALLLTSAMALDTARAALIRQDAGRPSHVPLARQSWKDPLMMTHASPDHIAVSAASLRDLAHEVALLSARVSMFVDAAGVDLAPPTVLPDNVYRLSDYRARAPRQAVSR